jgi:hypothetical protein
MHTSHKIWLFSSISGVQRRCLLPPSPAQRGKVRKGVFKSIKNNDLFSCFSPPPRPSPASGRGGYTEHLNSCVHRVNAGEGSMGSGYLHSRRRRVPRSCWERAKIIVLDHRALYSASEDDRGCGIGRFFTHTYLGKSQKKRGLDAPPKSLLLLFR